MSDALGSPQEAMDLLPNTPIVDRQVAKAACVAPPAVPAPLSAPASVCAWFARATVRVRPAESPAASSLALAAGGSGHGIGAAAPCVGSSAGAPAVEESSVAASGETKLAAAPVADSNSVAAAVEEKAVEARAVAEACAVGVGTAKSGAAIARAATAGAPDHLPSHTGAIAAAAAAGHSHSDPADAGGGTAAADGERPPSSAAAAVGAALAAVSIPSGGLSVLQMKQDVSQHADDGGESAVLRLHRGASAFAYALKRAGCEADAVRA